MLEQKAGVAETRQPKKSHRRVGQLSQINLDTPKRNNMEIAASSACVCRRVWLEQVCWILQESFIMRDKDRYTRACRKFGNFSSRLIAYPVAIHNPCMHLSVRSCIHPVSRPSRFLSLYLSLGLCVSFSLSLCYLSLSLSLSLWFSLSLSLSVFLSWYPSQFLSIPPPPQLHISISR